VLAPNFKKKKREKVVLRGSPNRSSRQLSRKKFPFGREKKKANYGGERGLGFSLQHLRGAPYLCHGGGKGRRGLRISASEIRVNIIADWGEILLKKKRKKEGGALTTGQRAPSNVEETKLTKKRKIRAPTPAKD